MRYSAYCLDDASAAIKGFLFVVICGTFFLIVLTAGLLNPHYAYTLRFSLPLPVLSAYHSPVFIAGY